MKEPSELPDLIELLGPLLKQGEMIINAAIVIDVMGPNEERMLSTACSDMPSWVVNGMLADGLISYSESNL